MDAEAEKSTYSAFERFLYWFFIPIVFTMVLAGALLSLFDYDVVNQVLKVADKIPGVSAIAPDPKGAAKPVETVMTENDDAASTASDSAAVIEELMMKLAKAEAQLQAADNAYQQKDQALKELQAELAAMEEEAAAQGRTDEEYQAVIKETAAMYAKMMPSKAAPIMENLTLQEQVMLLGEMKTEDRVEILEKMNPKSAAEASILLKDVIPSRDREIAALQERLKLNEANAAADSTTPSKSDLGQTFSSMTPKSAANLLIEMEKTSPAKVTDILKAMDVQGRSKVMSAIADQAKETAAAITVRLAQ